MQNRSSRFQLKCTILKRLRTLSLCHNLCVTACIPLWNYCVTVASIFSQSFVSAFCLWCLNPWSLFTYTRLTALCPGLPGWAGTRKVKSIWILLKQETEWQWQQLGRMQVCTSLQTDNHASTPPLSFYRPDALPAAQPTASKNWRPPWSLFCCN